MPNNVEIERKYIIKKPDLEILSNADGYTVSKITQTYIQSDLQVTHRVRKREFKDKTVYTETKKLPIDNISVHEFEREISEYEYTELAKNIKSGTHPVLKTRHTFDFCAKTIEIDIYPEWKNTCIMEIELQDREETVKIPPFIYIMKEVTGDRSFSNAAMSYAFPEEYKQTVIDE